MRTRYSSFTMNKECKIKKRALSYILTLCMLLSCIYLPVFEASADGNIIENTDIEISQGESFDGKNLYEHEIVYKPVDTLITGKPYIDSDAKVEVKLFDATKSQWNDEINREGTEVTSTSSAKAWLETNNFLLNKLFIYYPSYSSSYSQSWGLTSPCEFNGTIKLNKNGYKTWLADFKSYAMEVRSNYTDEFMNSEDTGNMLSMLKKGDVEFLLAAKVRPVSTSWWGKPNASQDTGTIKWGDGESVTFSGNGLKAYNYTNNDESGIPNLNSLNGWNNASASHGNKFYFEARSNKDDQNDCYLRDGVIIARDAKGPSIKSVYLSSDKEGKERIDSVITLDMLHKLTDNTVYFQVEMDEPVKFAFDENFKEEHLEKLSLKVQTIGKDGTSGNPAEAPFLSFAPAQTDSTQRMTFEYKILNPYKDYSILAQQRGTFYTFSKVNVNAKENKTLWNYITDLSGNKFYANGEGVQVTSSAPSCSIDGSPKVDLEPFAIESISVTKDIKPNQTYVIGGELFTFDIKFNKPFDETGFYWGGKNVAFPSNFSCYPTVTTNLIDEVNYQHNIIVNFHQGDRETPIKKRVYDSALDKWVETDTVYPWTAGDGALYPVVPKTTFKGEKGGTTTDTVSYSIQLYTGFSMFQGDEFIHIDEIMPTIYNYDYAGNKLLTYEYDSTSKCLVPTNLPQDIIDYCEYTGRNDYNIPLDKQYKLDFGDPEITAEFNNLENDVVAVKANIELKTALEEGTEASFDINLEGTLGDVKMQYQLSTDGSYDDSRWNDCGGTSLHVSSPIKVTNEVGESFVMLKLKGTEGEITGIQTNITVTDVSGNTGTVSARGVPDYDFIAPRINIRRRGDGYAVVLDDAHPNGFAYAWTETGAGEPDDSLYTAVSENSFDVPTPELPEGNAIYAKTLWVKATDSFGNASGVISKNCKFDKSFTDIILSVDDPDKTYYGTDYPEVKVKLTNAFDYFCTWVEVPANYNTSTGNFENVYDYLESDYMYWFSNNWNGNSEHTDLSGLNSKLEFNIEDEDSDLTGHQSYREFTVSINEKTKIAPVFNDDDLKWGNHPSSESSWDYGTYVRPAETKGAIMLIVAVRDYYGRWRFKTLELDTMLGDSPVEVRQSRFTTYDKAGNRVDYKRTSGEDKGLYWADDTKENLGMFEVYNPVNNTLLGTVAESEFYIAGDPLTGFEKIDMENSSIQLVKVGYNYFYGLKSEEKVTTLKEWKLSDLNLVQRTYGTYQEDYSPAVLGDTRVGVPCSPTYSAVVSFDPSIIAPSLSEYYINENEESDSRCIRYEFRFKRAYKGENKPDDEIVKLSYFAFNNYLNGNSPFYGVNSVLNSTAGGYNSFDAKLKQASFDAAGNDITQDVPLVMFNFGPNSSYGTVGDGTEAYLKFGMENGYGEYELLADAPTGYLLGSQININYGTDPNNLSAYKVDMNTISFGSGEVGPFIFPENGDQIRVYYQFEETIKGVKSPIYVIDVRRDEIGPTINMTVSETNKRVNEVSVKIDSVYDAHNDGSGLMITDTPSNEIYTMIEAQRYVYDGEVLNTTNPDGADYINPDDIYEDEYGRQIVPVYPDENGVYRFTNNGFIWANAIDSADNWSTLYVNGEELERTDDEMYIYAITNIDKEAPLFEEEPSFTENHDNGSTAITAKVNAEDVKNILIKFDDEYAVLTGIKVDAEADTESVVALKNALGIANYSFNSETGELSAEIYAKYNESGVPITSASIILVDEAGNRREFAHTFTTPVEGIKPMVTNSKDEISGNVNNLPVLGYGEALAFNVPVSIPDYNSDLNTEHTGLPIYSDGNYEITYYDIFGTEYTEYIYSNVSSEAFAHKVSFTADGKKTDLSQKTNKDIKVTIDTSGTEYLYVGNGTGTLYEETLTENDVVTYTLYNRIKDEERTFNISVSNIDKTAPEAIVAVDLETVPRAEGGYDVLSVKYTVEGFEDESDVEILANETGEITSEYTFNKNNKDSTYTFKFRDEAGNEGSYTVDASGYMFADYADKQITGYRLSYFVSSQTGVSSLGSVENSDLAIPVGTVNGDISVKVEALNASGESVPFAMSNNGSSSGVLIAGSTIMFAGEDAYDRIASVKLTGDGSGNTLPFETVLPGGTVDKTAPTGTVEYVAISDETIRIYLISNNTDIAENGVSVKGEREDGSLLTLQKDEKGYYVDTNVNVSGYFILTDKAGNIGNVAVAVIGIDNTPPEKKTEGWSSVFEASTEELIKKLLETPTNNSIKIFFSFNEQLSKTDVKAYDNQTDKNELTPTSEFVTAVTSGNTVVVEFKQNCIAKIDVYDTSNNCTTLWRPEDGPITVIDKDAPKLLEGYPQINTADNKVTMVYKFAENEEVMLLTGKDTAYKNEHTIVFTENGQQILTFADEAGNVFSAYPVISGIDDMAPAITSSFADEANHIEYSENPDGTITLGTSGAVVVRIKAEDATPDGLEIKVKDLKGVEYDVVPENKTITDEDNVSVTYTHKFVAEENGVYEIIAKDKWNLENTLRVNITMIDKVAPTINMITTQEVKVIKNTDESEVKTAVLSGVTAKDSQSGVAENGLSVDLSDVDLAKSGSYAAKINATDKLGNTATKTRVVVVYDEALRLFNVNGETVEENDVYLMQPGHVNVSTDASTFKNEKITLYYAQGYRTKAQMKYATPFNADTGFDASVKGYYTVLAQSAERSMHLVYIYVH